MRTGVENILIYNFRFNNFINTGAMLCNLEELREGNISNKIKNFLIKYNNKLKFPLNETLISLPMKKNGYFSEE